MPTYEYKCKVCEDRFDIEQSFSDDALTVLEGCSQSEDGDHRLKKVFSAVGISFKGDGFYRNDSRSTKSSTTPSTESSSSSSDSGSSTSSSESSSSSKSDSSSSTSTSTSTSTTSSSSSGD